MRLHVCLLAALAGCPSAGICRADPISDRICAAARPYVKRGGEDALLIGNSLTDQTPWTLAQGDVAVAGHAPKLFLAFFKNTDDSLDESSGALSFRVSTFVEPNQQTASDIDLHRAPIARGVNACERAGRDEFKDTRPFTEFVRYHHRQGDSASLHEFHFRYLTGGRCVSTDQPGAPSQSFQFPEVSPEETPGFFSWSAQAYPNHVHLRSELHYYRRAAGEPACVGFGFRFDMPSARIVVTDLAAGQAVELGRWSLHLQPPSP